MTDPTPHISPIQLPLSDDHQKSSMANDHHFIDIHPVVKSDEHCTEKKHQPAKGPIKRNLSISRRVSPESMELKELEASTSKKEPQQSGKCLGAKGDFSKFRTGGRSMSMQPTRNLQNMEAGRHGEETVADIVPAGRYFAALQGPEFDEVKLWRLLFGLSFMMIVPTKFDGYVIGYHLSKFELITHLWWAQFQVVEHFLPWMFDIQVRIVRFLLFAGFLERHIVPASHGSLFVLDPQIVLQLCYSLRGFFGGGFPFAAFSRPRR